jgi:hypothetical protein
LRKSWKGKKKLNRNDSGHKIKWKMEREIVYVMDQKLSSNEMKIKQVPQVIAEQ